LELGVIAVAQLMTALDATIVNIALPLAQRYPEGMTARPTCAQHSCDGEAEVGPSQVITLARLAH
jgi:hypothetical protein